MERLAEVAASGEAGITDARGRYSVDDLAVEVTVRRARNVAATLKAAQDRVIDALAEHGLPSMPVNVTLSSYDRRERRELR